VRKHVLLAALMASFAGGLAHAAESAQNITWAQLVPVEKSQARPPKPFFAGATPGAAPGSASHDPTAVQGDAKWMSGANKGPSSAPPAPIVAELNGKRVRLGGYVVPLDFDATKVTEFLLVPFVGACIHVPPPPANQIIFVKLSAGFEVGGTFDPVTVTGKLSAAQTFTGLAETGYSIDAETVQLRPK
jgi:uncharacterized protein